MCLSGSGGGGGGWLLVVGLSFSERWLLALGFGSEREGREQRNNEREREREPIWNYLIKKIRERIKYYYLSLELCYSVILKVELYYSTIAKFFTILGFYKSGCGGDFGLLR